LVLLGLHAVSQSLLVVLELEGEQAELINELVFFLQHLLDHGLEVGLVLTDLGNCLVF
jgi:hypothetical protein